MSDLIELGDKVEDEVTGVVGIVIGMTKWLAQCDRAIVQPQGTHEGKPIEAFSVDVPHLKVIKKQVVKQNVQIVTIEGKTEVRRTGGPRPTPKRQSL